MSSQPYQGDGGVDLTSLLGLSPTSTELSQVLASLGTSPSSAPLTASIASYPDIVYLSYHSLGLSLSFEPTISSYRPKYKLSSLQQLECDKLYCVGIDVYNHEMDEDDEDDKSHHDDEDAKTRKPSSSVAPTKEYERFPTYPILLPRTPRSTSPFPLVPTTTGKELVEAYGEPTRKGGGDTKGMGIWTEWTQEGIMVEWRSGGLGAWDKGGESKWRVLSLFEGGVGKGKDDEEE